MQTRALWHAMASPCPCRHAGSEYGWMEPFPVPSRSLACGVKSATTTSVSSTCSNHCTSSSSASGTGRPGYLASCLASCAGHGHGGLFFFCLYRSWTRNPTKIFDLLVGGLRYRENLNFFLSNEIYIGLVLGIHGRIQSRVLF